MVPLLNTNAFKRGVNHVEKSNFWKSNIFIGIHIFEIDYFIHFMNAKRLMNNVSKTPSKLIFKKPRKMSEFENRNFVSYLFFYLHATQLVTFGRYPANGNKFLTQNFQAVAMCLCWVNHFL